MDYLSVMVLKIIAGIVVTIAIPALILAFLNIRPTGGHLADQLRRHAERVEEEDENQAEPDTGGPIVLSTVIANAWRRIFWRRQALAGPYEEGVAAIKRGDYAEAVKWYRLAAEQGHAKAQNNLSIMYAQGRGVPQDYVQAHTWFNLAALRYQASEAKERDRADRNRDLAASKMTPTQIAEAQRLAREWKPK